MSRDFRLIRRRFDVVDAEGELGVTPVDLQYPVGDPRRYGAGRESLNDTVAVQTAIDVVSAIENRAAVDLDGQTYIVETLTIDSRRIRITNGTLAAHADIPAGGAIILSLAGGSDETVNQALLDAIYGTDVYLVRTNVAGSLENVHFDNLTLIGVEGTDLRGMWFTGFTRGCHINGCYFVDLEEAGIVINGSWSFQLNNNFLIGNSVGVGIMIGTTGNGERSGATACNAVTLINNEVTDFDEGCVWDAGVGGSIIGNIWEFNVTRGFVSQSVTGVAYHGNYHEYNGLTTANNDGNMRIGGTNGSDFAEGWDITGNRFNADAAAGHNIILRGIKNCRIGQNNFATSVGDRTQWYNIIGSTGSAGLQLDNVIEIPDLSSTYATNAATEIDGLNNRWYRGNGKKFLKTENGNFTFDLLAPLCIVQKTAGGGGETWTIDDNTAYPAPTGTEIDGANNGGGTLTVAIDTDTLIWAATGGTGSRTIAAGGKFKLTKVATTTWMIEGFGIT